MSQTLPSSESDNSVTEITRLETIVSSSSSPENRVDPIKSNAPTSSSKPVETNAIEVIDVSSDESNDEDQNGEHDLEEEEDESGDDYEFDYSFGDDSKEFNNFGVNKQEEDVPSQSCSSTVNKEQEQMELFWKLIDMGFSRGKELSTTYKR